RPSKAVPKNRVKNTGLRIVRLIDCMAAMPVAAGRRPKACMMKAEKAKNSPAIMPAPRAARITNNCIRPFPPDSLLLQEEHSQAEGRRGGGGSGGCAGLEQGLQRLGLVGGDLVHPQRDQLPKRGADIGMIGVQGPGINRLAGGPERRHEIEAER